MSGQDLHEALPVGWAQVPIGTFARIVGGGTPPSKDPANFAPVGQGTPWVTPADLSGYRAQTIDRGARDLSAVGLAASGATLMPKGSVLFSSRAPIGYVAIAANEISTNQGFKSFVLPNGFDPRFTYYQLKHLKPEAEAIATGTTFKELSGSAAATLPFKVAPLPEQIRIADQLDKLFAHIQACNDRLDAIPALLKRFRQVVLAAATTGKLTDTDDLESAWDELTIGSIAIDLRYGTSKKCEYTSIGTGVLRIPNIADHGRIDVGDLKRAEFHSKEIEKLALREGDLLVIRSNGSVDLVGKTSLVKAPEVGLLFAGYLMRLRVDQSRALPAFIQLCLSAPAQRAYIERTAKSTSGVNNLNAEELRALVLRLPSLAEQADIVRRVEALFKLAARIEAGYTAACTRTLRIFPLLLAKAFRGELVPQNPNDESASTLLSSLAAERGQTGAAHKAQKVRVPRTNRPPKSLSSSNKAMPNKSRQDDDVKGLPYLAEHLRHLGQPVDAKTLFEVSELPVADFYKQLAWEIAEGFLNGNNPLLEASLHEA